mmetsp:Transcript_6732/g.12459  ORF Transcript_6732/g.12459 Transcript_6732/m.12459 type:complete len:123 (+) Transcript_6732:619-987(+)
MVRCEAAATQEGEFFLGASDLFFAVEIFEIRFGDAAETLLEPPSPSLTDFDLFAVLQLAHQDLVSSFHCFTHDDYYSCLREMMVQLTMNVREESNELELSFVSVYSKCLERNATRERTYVEF